MCAPALVAVLGYLYTERLLVAPSLLLNVAAIARNLKLHSLAIFSEQEAVKESQRSTTRRVVVIDFGKDYVVGAFPPPDSLRCDFYNNLVHNGMIPKSAFLDTRAAGDDVDEDGETIIIGEEWEDKNDYSNDSSSSSTTTSAASLAVQQLQDLAKLRVDLDNERRMLEVMEKTMKEENDRFRADLGAEKKARAAEQVARLKVELEVGELKEQIATMQADLLTNHALRSSPIGASSTVIVPGKALPGTKTPLLALFLTLPATV
jgi:hypothetical protein